MDVDTEKESKGWTDGEQRGSSAQIQHKIKLIDGRSTTGVSGEEWLLREDKLSHKSDVMR